MAVVGGGGGKGYKKSYGTRHVGERAQREKRESESNGPVKKGSRSIKKSQGEKYLKKRSGIRQIDNQERSPKEKNRRHAHL